MDHFRKRGPTEFFDSLGRAPEHYNRRFKRVLVKNGPRFIRNKSRVQPYGTLTCGHYCLKYLTYRCRGWTMNRIIREMRL